MQKYLDLNDIRIVVRLLTVIWLGLSFVVLLREVVGNITIRNWDYDAFDDLYNITFRMWLPWVIMSPLVVLLIKRFLFYPEQWLKNLGLHLLFVAFFTLIHLAAVAYQYQVFEDNKLESMKVYAGWEHMGHFLVADPFILSDIIIYVLFVASFNISSHIQMVRENEQNTSRLETYLAESKLQALQMQVNPHFLFNTLNSISVLVQKNDTKAAGEMIHRLSDFFRMTLEKSVGQLVPLESELELLDNYLAIEQERFQDRLSIVRQIDGRTLSVDVPTMLLQPLVENSLRHGINNIDGQGKIEIKSSFLADRILLEISDNGPGDVEFYGPSFNEGIGLSNVRARLQQLYGDNFVFTINSSVGEGVRVSIEIPVETGQHLNDNSGKADSEDYSMNISLNTGKA